MMKNVINKNSGVTLVSLAIAVSVILILTGVIIYNVRDNLGISNLREMQSDIQNLRDLVSDYYSTNGKIPAKLKYTNTENIERIRTTGVISEEVDIGDFYIIDLSELENLTLNYGEDYKNISNATTEDEASQYEDIYIINETSQNIFYVEGIQLDGEMFYTDYTSEDVDKVAINLRYFDGVKIPDGYIYNSGTSKEDLFISDKDDVTKIYNWVITDQDIEEIPSDVQIAEDEQADFIKSVNLFDGYYKSSTDNTVVYIVNEEKWSPTYDVDGTYTDKNGDTATIPAGFQVSEKKGETLIDEGLVIRNATTDDRYVWIEVPKSIYTTATSETDYSNIEKDMQTYTAKYKIGKEGYADVWYDGSGNTVENTSNRNDTTGCGLTYDEYNNLKETMLSRVYTNGGFWIGQYEAGSSIIRKDGNAELTMPVVKEGVYPYNYITCSNAQIQTAKMNSGSYTSSLMFGIQRDLVLKYLEISQKLAVEEITSDSKNWGNYSNSNFSIVKGEYSEDYGATFRPINGSYEKVGDKSVLLTTGATDRNSRMNIYDLAGNVFEWTLERSNKTSNPCADRGGMFNYSGSEGPASYRGSSSTSYNFFNSGFRPALY